jgi:hypothetical protein
MIEIDIKRGSDIVATVKPNDNSNQQKRIMGDNIVNLSFNLDRMVNFNIGDYALIYGENYFINKIPTVKKDSTYGFEYDMILQHSQYELANAQYLFYGSDNTLKEGDFSLHGTADDFIDLLVKNMNRISSGWVKGGVIQTDYKNLTFSKQDCLTAIGTIAKEFDTEFYIEGTTIHLAKKIVPIPFVFKYGSNKGLYDITRSQNESTKVITRLYCFGSTKNIPSDYRNFSQRLLLPGTYDETIITELYYTTVDNGDGTQTFTFNFIAPTSLNAAHITIVYRNLNDTAFYRDRSGLTSPRTLTVPSGDYEFYFQTEMTDGLVFDTPPFLTLPIPIFPLFPRASVPYLEKNVSLYGVIEATYINDDIYPHRTGRVAAVDGSNLYTFKDTFIDFNVNDQLLPGLSAKITFNTGQLTGYTFEIKSFNNSTKEFSLLKNKDEKTLDIPSASFRPSIGDTYVLTDIKMPQTYIDAAEQALLLASQQYLDDNSVPQYSYSITCDPKYFRKHKVKMDTGNRPFIQDTDLQIERPMRVIGLTKSLIDEYEYTLEISDVISQNIIAQIQSSQSTINTTVSQVQQTLNNNSFLNGIIILNLPQYSDNSAALTGGLKQGQLYQTSGAVKIVI